MNKEINNDLAEVPLTSLVLTINLYKNIGKFDELVERLQRNGQDSVIISASLFNEARKFLEELNTSNSIISSDICIRCR